MKEIKHLLRTGYISQLRDQVTYLGQVIPIDEAYENLTPALLQVGNSSGIEAYMIIRNQSVNDDSAKCGINQDSPLQLDVITVFNGNAGNSYHADMITQIVFDRLFGVGGRKINFTIPGLDIWRGWLFASYQPTEEDADTKTFRNVLIFNHSVGQ